MLMHSWAENSVAADADPMILTMRTKTRPWSWPRCHCRYRPGVKYPDLPMTTCGCSSALRAGPWRTASPGVSRMQPDAAGRCRAAEAVDLVGAVHREITAVEDRIRHRRAIVAARTMVLRHPSLAVHEPRWRHLAAPRRGDLPPVHHLAATCDRHGLRRKIDFGDNRRCRCRDRLEDHHRRDDAECCKKSLHNPRIPLFAQPQLYAEAGQKQFFSGHLGRYGR